MTCVKVNLLKGYAYIDPRKLVSKKNPQGRQRYYVIAIVDDKKKSHGGFDLLKDARSKKHLLESQIAGGTYGKKEKKNYFFDEYYEEWWQGKCRSLKPASQRAYSSSYALYILPYFQRMRISDITGQTVQQFIGTLQRLSPGYIRTIYSHFRALMNKALDDDVIAKSPCKSRSIDLPRAKMVDLHYLEPSEVWVLIDAIDLPYKALFGILAFTGMRVGEVLALRVKHIDFQRKEIRIEEAWNVNTREFHEPKSKAGLRRIGILLPLAELLKQYFEYYPISGRDSLLFPSVVKPNQPVSYNTVWGVFKRNLKKVGLQDVKIHSLRHTFASTMLATGVPGTTLARYLGHATPDITYRIYGHQISVNLGDALNRAGAQFSAAREANIVDLNEWRENQP